MRHVSIFSDYSRGHSLVKNLSLFAVAFVCVACSTVQTTSVDVEQPVVQSDGGIHGRGADTDKWWHALPRKEWADYKRVLPEEPWFEVYRVLPNIFAIYEPRQFEEVISFLVVGTERALLFDTGLGIARMRPVVSQLTDQPLIVVNSHSHYDHVGGNFEFDHIKGLDDAFAHNNSKGRSHEQVREFISGDWMAKPIPAGIDVGDYAIEPYEIAEYLRDGAIIDLGSRKMQVIRTPGHTPDSLCLFDRDNRLLLTGDTFYLAPLYAHLKEANVADYYRSVERLAAMADDVDMLLTAHNVPIANGDYLLKLKAAFDAIASGTLDYLSTEGAREYQFDGFSIIAPGQ